MPRGRTSRSHPVARLLLAMTVGLGASLPADASIAGDARDARPSAGQIHDSIASGLRRSVAAAAAPSCPDASGFNLCPDRTVALDVATLLTDQELGAYRPRKENPKIALISSGVDTSVFPADLKTRITGVGTTALQDSLGYGTYVASILLQVARDASIVSFSVYSGTAFHAEQGVAAFDAILKAAKADPSAYDAVLYSAPSSAYLDPISSTIMAGHWQRTVDALGDEPAVVATASRPAVYGVPMDAPQWDNYIKRAPRSNRSWLIPHRARLVVWNSVLNYVKALRAVGLPVVAPAGDIGPGLQTIVGIPSLPEVLAVGAANDRGVAPKSASGPSMDGSIKPDLLAPAGILGIAPSTSALADAIRAKKVPLSTDSPRWRSAQTPSTDIRATLDTSFTSAAVVAAEIAGLRARGIRDGDRLRGAVLSGSKPLASVPVWRQGFGVLPVAPDAFFDDSGKVLRPLILGPGSIGLERADWKATVRVLTTSSAPTVPSKVSLDSFARVGLDGANQVVPANAAVGPAPETHNCPSNDCTVHLHVTPAGNEDAGLHCGFVRFSFPGSTPIDTPACAIKGMNLTAHAYYIADQSGGENLTFGLVPTIPPSHTPIEHSLAFLPTDPTGPTIEFFFAKTDANGDARFVAIPPGYYQIRLFADFGLPVVENGKQSDLGQPMLYRGVSAYVLPPALCDTMAGVFSAGCKARLEAIYGAGKVSEDPATGTYRAGGNTLVFGAFKNSPGPIVGARFVDLVSCKDFALAGTVGKTTGWTAAACDDKQEDLFRASLDVASATSGRDPLGVLTYTVPLPRPNYRVRVSLDLVSRQTNADIEVLLGKGTPLTDNFRMIVGGDVYAVTPETAAGIETGAITSLAGQALGRSSEAKAAMDFALTTENQTSDLTVQLRFIPRGGASPVAPAAVAIKNLALRIENWSPLDWGSATVQGGPGHTVRFQAAFDPTRLSPSRCRKLPKTAEAFDAARTGPDQCEEWVGFVHAPKNRAAIIDVRSCGEGVSLLATATACPGGGRSILSLVKADPGSGFFDPQFLPKVADPPWPIFRAGHKHALNGPVEAGADIPCETSGRGKFWKILRLPASALTDAGYRIGSVFEVQIKDGLRSVSGALLGATKPDVEGSSPVGLFNRVAVPSALPIIAAPPGLGRIALLVGLALAAIVAALLVRRRLGLAGGTGGDDPDATSRRRRRR